MGYVFFGAALAIIFITIAAATKKDTKPSASSGRSNRGRQSARGRGSYASRESDRARDSGGVAYSIEVSYQRDASITGTPRTSAECWVGPGKEARVGKRRISGGMLYVGNNLPSVGSRHSVEPALIDPELRRRDDRPDATGQSMGYWPSYSSIAPECRSGFLSWLEGGRRDPGIGIGYVFLFLYGLERRALHDAAADADARRELPAIQAEVVRLLEIYSGNSSFRRYATAFLDTLGFMASRFAEAPPPLPYRNGSEVPLDIRHAAGMASLQRRALPGPLAFAWATSDPTISLRTPARRCDDEFRELFLRRYERRYGDGLVIAPCKRMVRVEYRPASASFSTPFSSNTDIPNVTALVAPRRKLADLVEEVTTALEDYSRKLGRDPSVADRSAAAALLPAELLDSHAPDEVKDLLHRLSSFVQQKSPQVCSATEVLGLWLPADGSRQSKRAAVEAVTLLAKSGIGVEPDVRFGGPRLTSGDSVAVFGLAPLDPSAPSAAYAGASLLLHLAAIVATADGEVAPDEREALHGQVSRSISLEEGERKRLAAHVEWLLASPPGTAGIKKRIEALSPEQCRSLGRFLLQVAAADGRIDPTEVTTLTKLFRLLGLDPSEIHLELHTLQASSTAADQPVLVAPGEPEAPGVPIPARPNEPTASGTHLDMSLVEAKLHESASVSALLSGIFAEEDEPDAIAPHEDEGEAGILGRHYVALLRDLSQREVWGRDEYEALAEQHGVMPDGALDTLNELAWDTCDEALVEGTDPMEINLDICQQLLST